MSLFNTKTVTVKRYTNGNYDTPDGSWQEGTESTFTIKCSWQPATGDDLKAIPEGRRSSSMYKLYTSTKLRTTDQLSQLPRDIVISSENGFEYELNETADNQNGIVSHYKYIATRVKEAG